MTGLNLKHIPNGNEFDRFCRELFKAEYPDFICYDDSMGDGGVDGSRANGKILYQFYFPDLSSLPVRSEKMKRKITATLKKVLKKKPEEWCFVIPCDAQETVYNHLAKKQHHNPGIHMRIIDSSEIMTLLAKHQHIEQAWVTKITGVAQALSPAAITFDKRDSPSEVVSIGLDVAKSLKNWKFGDLYSQKLVIDSGTGNAMLSFVPNSPEIAKTHPFTLEGTLRFAREDLENQDITKLIHNGVVTKPIVFRGDQIESIQSRIGDHPFKLFDEITSIAFIPIKNAPRPLRINLYNKSHLLVKTLDDCEYTCDISDYGIDLKCRKRQDENFEIILSIHEMDKACVIEINKIGVFQNAHMAFEYLSIVESVGKAKTIEVEPEGVQKALEFEKPIQVQSREFKRTYRLSKMVKEISEMLRIEMPSILDMEITKNDELDVENTHGILKTGKQECRISSISITLSKVNPDMIKILESGPFFRIKQTGTADLEILSRKLCIGGYTRYFYVEFNRETILALSRAVSMKKSIKVVLKPPADNNKCVEFFHDWHRKPKELRVYEQ